MRQNRGRPTASSFCSKLRRVRASSLWTFSLQDRKSTPIAGVQSTGLLDPMFSPDGRWIAYQSNQTGALQVYVQPFPSTGATSIRSRRTAATNPSGRPTASNSSIFPVSGGGQFAVVTIATATELHSWESRAAAAGMGRTSRPPGYTTSCQTASDSSPSPLPVRRHREHPPRRRSMSSSTGSRN